MPTATTYRAETAKSAHELLTTAGVDEAGIVRALVRAELTGTSRAGSASVLHTGYADDATMFNAGTALYRITF